VYILYFPPMSIELRKGAELQQRYVISELIGQGGFGTVWRATDKQYGRDVAIKRMLKRGGGDELEAILQEARKTARLKGHKNIVEMYEGPLCS
jgi:eukaryotic-like serine/threonine-protein kinase